MLETALNNAAATAPFTVNALLPLLPQALVLQSCVLDYIKWVRRGDAAWLAWVLLLLVVRLQCTSASDPAGSMRVQLPPGSPDEPRH